MKKCIICVVVSISILSLLLMIGPVPVQAAEPIILKAVVPMPVFIPIVAPVKNMYVPGIEKACGGKLVVKLLGGPEIIPM